MGIEVLPVGCFAIQSRLAADRVSASAFQKAAEKAAEVDFEEHWEASHCLEHVAITRGAFPEANERQLVGYLAYCRKNVRDRDVRTLMTLAAFCILESISYTRKDGQYLRWDHRSNRSRGEKAFDKGAILTFRQAIRDKLRQMSSDLQARSLLGKPRKRGTLDLRVGSCLDVLPTLPSDSVDFVLTSPPYCNRYDYTRTYALELVFLGCDQPRIRDLRQQMLSCTVENNEKVSLIRNAYEGRGRLKAWEIVDDAFRSQAALQEVLQVLEDYRVLDKLNNPNIVKMVRNYFYEMAFVVYEMARVMQPGGKAVIVNDNVRYAGEEVPADLILSSLAEQFGLTIRHIWTLPRGKGNSSQQMGNHGRTELRKCVYAWEK